MQISEGLIDKWVAQAVKNGNGSDTCLKRAALAAYYVVGKYNGGTQQICQQTRRRPSTVENWAHAAKFYKQVRKVLQPAGIRRARELWHTLPISFWYMAHDEIYKRTDDVMQAWYYLMAADAHNWSSRDMVEEFRVDYEAEHGAPPPAKIETVYNRAVSVVTDIKARIGEIKEPRIAEWARQGMNLFAELGLIREEE